MEISRNKRVTITCIAKEVGLSPTTVSYVLRDQAKQVAISEATSKKIKDKALEMGYVPNTWAKNLRNQRSKTITVVLTNLGFSWSQEVMDGISPVIRQSGYSSLVAIANTDPVLAMPDMNSIVQRRDEGVIIHPARALSTPYELIINNNIPVVFLGDIPECLANHEAVNCVIWDDGPAINKGINYLIEKGYKKIGFWGFTHGVISDARRFKAYKTSLQNAGLEVCEERIYWHTDAHEDKKIGLNKLLQNKETRPDAIFAINDVVAIQLMEKCSELGIKIPDDLAILGLGNISMSALKMIGLTTIEEPVEALGKKSAEILLDIINNPNKQPIHESVTSEKLIIRTST